MRPTRGRRRSHPSSTKNGSASVPGSAPSHPLATTRTRTGAGRMRKHVSPRAGARLRELLGSRTCAAASQSRHTVHAVEALSRWFRPRGRAEDRGSGIEDRGSAPRRFASDDSWVRRQPPTHGATKSPRRCPARTGKNRSLMPRRHAPLASRALDGLGSEDLDVPWVERKDLEPARFSSTLRLLDADPLHRSSSPEKV